MSPANAAISAYHRNNVYGRVVQADPHTLIAQLFAGALDRIRFARACVLSGDRARKAGSITAALDIIDGLRMALDRDQGGDLAERLDALYEYVTLRLTQANAANDVSILDESDALIATIAQAWEKAPRSANGGARE